MSYYHVGVREFKAADGQFFHAGAIYSFDQATGTTRNSGSGASAILNGALWSHTSCRYAG
jgi:hypothetical protein